MLSPRLSKRAKASLYSIEREKEGRGEREEEEEREGERKGKGEREGKRREKRKVGEVESRRVSKHTF